MVHLLKYLFNMLSEAQEPVYFEHSPSNAVYPYIVFKLPDSVNLESDREDFFLTVDIWDNKPDTTELENLTDEIDRILNEKRVLDENQFLMLDRESRLIVPDELPEIKRRQLQYTIKRYER